MRLWFKIGLTVGMLFPLLTHAQYFNNRYPIDSSSAATAFNAIENDSGYLMVGGYAPFGYYSSLALIQTDFNGNVLFQKTYKSNSVPYFAGFQGSLQKVSSGGYAMYGSLNEISESKNYALLYRFNDVGDTLWTKRFADTSTTYGYVGDNMKVTSDGGFICIGDRGSPSTPISIIKTDSLGNQQWEKFYGGTTYDKPTSVAVCSDGGYIYTSATKSGGVGLPKDNIRIMKVDSLGNMVFNKFFGGVYDDNAWSILQTQDGGYLFGGNFTFLDTSCNCQKANPYVIKLDSLGDTLWTRKYGEAMSNATVLNMYELTDGNIILCGISRKEQITGGDYQIQGLVFKIAANGDSLFYRLYRLLSSSSSHELRDIRPTTDGGFICSGIIYPAFPDTGTQDMWLLKLDSLGCADTVCALATAVEEVEWEVPFGDLGAFNLYPNPNQGTFTLLYSTQEKENTYLNIIDFTGKTVLQQTLLPKQGKETITMTYFPSGIYFVRISSKEGKLLYTSKLSIVK